MKESRSIYSANQVSSPECSAFLCLVNDRRQSTLAVTAKDLAREVFQEEMDRYLESQRVTLFQPDEKGAEFNRENTIIASACYSAVYNRMSNGLATPIEMAWWGEPWLNSLKARESSLDFAAT